MAQKEGGAFEIPAISLFVFSSARLGDLLQALLLAALVLDCRNSLLYGDLLWLQTGKSLL